MVFKKPALRLIESTRMQSFNWSVPLPTPWWAQPGEASANNCNLLETLRTMLTVWLLHSSLGWINQSVLELLQNRRWGEGGAATGVEGGRGPGSPHHLSHHFIPNLLLLIILLSIHSFTHNFTLFCYPRSNLWWKINSSNSSHFGDAVCLLSAKLFKYSMDVVQCVHVYAFCICVTLSQLEEFDASYMAATIFETRHAHRRLGKGRWGDKDINNFFMDIDPSVIDTDIRVMETDSIFLRRT